MTAQDRGNRVGIGENPKTPGPAPTLGGRRTGGVPTIESLFHRLRAIFPIRKCQYPRARIFRRNFRGLAERICVNRT